MKQFLPKHLVYLQPFCIIASNENRSLNRNRLFFLILHALALLQREQLCHLQERTHIYIYIYIYIYIHIHIGYRLTSRVTDRILVFIMLVFFIIYFFILYYFKMVEGSKVAKIFIVWCFESRRFFWCDEFFSLITIVFLFWKYSWLYFEFSIINLMIVSLLRCSFSKNSISSVKLLMLCFHYSIKFVFHHFFLNI